MPTRPGHLPHQLATVRIGPWCVQSPCSTWWLYCQTASATIKRSVGGNVAEHLHAVLLAVDEPVLLHGIVWMAALDFEPFPANGGDYRGFHSFLRGPTHPVG